MAAAFKLLDTLEACQEAVALLFEEAEVAIDLEGVKLSRKGEACIIQTYAPSRDQIYLFDIEVLKQSAFEEGGLKKLLEHEGILKIFYDVRADNDALFHLHNVNVKAAYDLQVLYDIKFTHPLNDKLVGLKKVMKQFFEESQTITSKEIRDLEELKEHGQRLFLPEHGGSYELWKQRPLSQELCIYAAADVKFLFDMKQYWGTRDADGEALDTIVKEKSMERLKSFVGLPDSIAGDQDRKKYRDFEIPPGFNKTGHFMAIVSVPRDKKGLIIGKKGATINAIRESSGAQVSIDDHSGNAKVCGRKAQVDAAVRCINDLLRPSAGYQPGYRR